MKALVLHNINDLHLETIPEPKLKKNDVLVSVKAAGICGSDIPRVYQTGAYSYPLVPGHEFAGVITATGPDVSNFWLGQRVGVFPLIPCGKCLPCKKSCMKCAGITAIWAPEEMVVLQNM